MIVDETSGPSGAGKDEGKFTDLAKVEAGLKGDSWRMTEEVKGEKTCKGLKNENKGN
jgi:hypothetical protein